MENLESKILSWLQKHGYPFELFVASSFQKKGFYVTQGRQYTDSDTGQSRELDIIAQLIKYVGEYQLNFSFIIECKSSKEKPWVAFMANDNTSEIEAYKKLSATSLGNFLLTKLKLSKPYLLNTFTNYSNSYAYSLVQALKTKDNFDVAFKGISTIEKAIEHYQKADNLIEKSISFYIPVLAIEAKLFECHLKIDNNIQLESVSKTQFLMRNGYDPSTSLFIDILTRESIDTYAENYKILLNEFVFRAENEIKKILETRQ